jgi:hypothetical protein
MSTVPEDVEVELIAHVAFRALRDMDAQCPTGLSNFVSCSPFAGKNRKDEAAITWALTNALGKRWHVEQCEGRYPEGGGRCDRVVELSDGFRLWLEVKLAWRTWFCKVVKHNDPRAYNGYLNGDYHAHSVAGDFAKLERIGRTHGRYLALLVVGFDGQDGVMVKDMAALAERERLEQRGWSLLSDAWATRQSVECWNRCWFAWRESPLPDVPDGKPAECGRTTR